MIKYGSPLRRRAAYPLGAAKMEPEQHPTARGFWPGEARHRAPALDPVTWAWSVPALIAKSSWLHRFPLGYR